jgi:hypothetical protein
LSKLIKINKPALRISYDLDGAGSAAIESIVRNHPSLA